MTPKHTIQIPLAAIRFKPLLAPLFLGLLLLIFPVQAFAQTCSFGEPQILYSFPGDAFAQPTPFDASLYRRPESTLPTISEQVLNPAQTFVNSPAGIAGFTAMEWDARSEILYFVDSMEGAGSFYGWKFPFDSNSPQLIDTIINAANPIITIDYSHEDKVYLGLSEFPVDAPPEVVIRSYPRSDPPATAIGVELTRFEGFLVGLTHKPGSATSIMDHSLIVTYEMQESGGGQPLTGQLIFGQTFPVNELFIDGNTVAMVNPVMADFGDGSDILFKVVEYDPITQKLIGFGSDLSESPVLVSTQLDAADPSAVLRIDSVSTGLANMSFVDCFDVKGTLVPDIGVEESRFYLYCYPFSAGSDVGLTGFNPASAVPVSNPLLAIAIPQMGFNPDGYSTTQLTCCDNVHYVDTDGDGLADCEDECPLDSNCPAPPMTPTPSPTPSPEPTVTPTPAPDTDGDMVLDVDDVCPDDFASEEDQQLVGLPLGCPCEDRFDADGDGLLNCQEPPEERLIPVGGQCFEPLDADGDGVANCEDPCPDDGNKVEPLICGCNIAETADCLSGCKPGFEDVGCGCGITDCGDNLGMKIITNRDVITDPPVVVVQDSEDPDAEPGSKDVTLTFETFDGAARAARRRARFALFLRSGQRMPLAKAQRKVRNRDRNITVSYEAILREVKNNRARQAGRRQSRKGELTFRNLPPGIYSTRYRAVLKKRHQTRRGKVITKEKATAFSPATTFTF